MANASGKRPNNKKPPGSSFVPWVGGKQKVGAKYMTSPAGAREAYFMGKAYKASAAAQESRPSGPTTRSGKPKPPPSRTTGSSKGTSAKKQPGKKLPKTPRPAGGYYR